MDASRADSPPAAASAAAAKSDTEAAGGGSGMPSEVVETRLLLPVVDFAEPLLSVTADFPPSAVAGQPFRWDSRQSFENPLFVLQVLICDFTSACPFSCIVLYCLPDFRLSLISLKQAQPCTDLLVAAAALHRLHGLVKVSLPCVLSVRQQIKGNAQICGHVGG